MNFLSLLAVTGFMVASSASAQEADLVHQEYLTGKDSMKKSVVSNYDINSNQIAIPDPALYCEDEGKDIEKSARKVSQKDVINLQKRILNELSPDCSPGKNTVWNLVSSGYRQSAGATFYDNIPGRYPYSYATAAIDSIELDSFVCCVRAANEMQKTVSVDYQRFQTICVSRETGKSLNIKNIQSE